MGDFVWWLKNILHIETLFYITIAIIVISILIFKKKPKILKQSFSDELTKNFYIDPRLFKHKPKKSTSKNEEKCREIFESIFGVRFESIRPDFLKNPTTGRNLELDGYNANIPTRLGHGLAFEYDGAQHAKYVPVFHGNDENKFKYQESCDKFKDMQCKKHGILLIRIPHTIAPFDLDRYIRDKLQREKLI